MTQPFQQTQFKKRISILVFLKGTTAPVVLYVEDPQGLYDELCQIVKNNSPTSTKIIEKDTIGPLKKICIQANQICAVAMQEEPYV